MYVDRDKLKDHELTGGHSQLLVYTRTVLVVVSIMSFSFHFGSFLYSGVCSDQLKLSIYDVTVVQNSSNGDVIEDTKRKLVKVGTYSTV